MASRPGRAASAAAAPPPARTTFLAPRRLSPSARTTATSPATAASPRAACRSPRRSSADARRPHHHLRLPTQGKERHMQRARMFEADGAPLLLPAWRGEGGQDVRPPALLRALPAGGGHLPAPRPDAGGGAQG